MYPSVSQETRSAKTMLRRREAMLPCCNHVKWKVITLCNKKQQVGDAVGREHFAAYTQITYIRRSRRSQLFVTSQFCNTHITVITVLRGLAGPHKICHKLCVSTTSRLQQFGIFLRETSATHNKQAYELCQKASITHAGHRAATNCHCCNYV